MLLHLDTGKTFMNNEWFEEDQQQMEISEPLLVFFTNNCSRAILTATDR
jgi:hypothetical protein